MQDAIERKIEKFSSVNTTTSNGPLNSRFRNHGYTVGNSNDNNKQNKMKYAQK